MHVDTIREAIRRAPFEPFQLRMNDGRIFIVQQPGYVAVSRRHVYYVDPDTDASVWLEPILIASLEFISKPPLSEDIGTTTNP